MTCQQCGRREGTHRGTRDSVLGPQPVISCKWCHGAEIRERKKLRMRTRKTVLVDLIEQLLAGASTEVRAEAKKVVELSRREVRS